MPPLERYARFLVRRAPVVVLVVLLVTAGMFAGIRRLRAEFSIDASLPQGHPFVAIDRQIRTEFGGRNTMIVAVVPREGDVWRPEVLEVVQRLTFDALELEDVMAQNVVSASAQAGSLSATPRTLISAAVSVSVGRCCNAEQAS